MCGPEKEKATGEKEAGSEKEKILEDVLHPEPMNLDPDQIDALFDQPETSRPDMSGRPQLNRAARRKAMSMLGLTKKGFK